MRTFREAVTRHETAAFFFFTFALSWSMWKAFDRLYLSGQIVAVPFIMLGMFGPGLVGIWLSAVVDPGPRLGSRKASVTAFAVAWLPATALITLDQVLNEGRSATVLTVAVSAGAALMPAFVVSSAFSRVPGVRRHLASLVRPKGSPRYYVLALVLFAGLWSLGVLISRVLGLPVPSRELPPAAASVGVGGSFALCFFYNVLPNGLSEEPGWRGFALPRLQARHSPIVASLVLWVFWALWHAPAYLGGFAPQRPVDALVEWVLVLPVTVVFTWLYNRARASLLATALLHPAMTTTARFLPITVVGLALLLVFTVFAVVSDRMWRRAATALA